MNDNREVETNRPPEGGFAVVVVGDQLAEPDLSLHATFDQAMTAALIDASHAACCLI